jgi:uncharacterized membrane protein
MSKLLYFGLDGNSIQLNLFPIFIFCMWDQYSLYINSTFLFITFGFKINIYDTTYV